MPSELRLYDVVVNGYATRMRLDDTDAARLGGTLVDGAHEDDQDADAAGSTEPTGPADQATRKARTNVANRARTAQDTK